MLMIGLFFLGLLLDIISGSHLAKLATDSQSPGGAGESPLIGTFPASGNCHCLCRPRRVPLPTLLPAPARHKWPPAPAPCAESPGASPSAQSVLYVPAYAARRDRRPPTVHQGPRSQYPTQVDR